MRFRNLEQQYKKATSQHLSRHSQGGRETWQVVSANARDPSYGRHTERSSLLSAALLWEKNSHHLAREFLVLQSKAIFKRKLLVGFGIPTMSLKPSH